MREHFGNPRQACRFLRWYGVPVPLACRFILVLTASSGLACAGQIVSLPGQTAAGGPAKTYSLSGTVTNLATGEPIRRALVHVNGPVQLSAFTGADGRFQITGVPEGQTFVTAEKPGFFDDQSVQPGVPNFGVNVGPGTNEFHLRLTPEARIRGRVLDTDGEPIEGLQVEILGQEIVEGHKQLQTRLIGNTDEKGNYRVEGLTPGPYFVRTMVHPVFAESWATSGNAYAPQYYPNGSDLSSAQGLELKPGQDAEADFTLHAAATSTISGVVAGAPQNGVSVSYEGVDGQQTGANYLQLDPQSGKFALRMAPYGTWTLHFTSNDTQGNAYYADQSVEISAPVISGLHVFLQAAPVIPVIVNHPVAIASTSQNDSSQPANQGPGVQVQLLPANTSNNERFYAAPQPGDSQGTLFFRGVRPGNYKVVAQAFGQECIESVSMGSVDLMRNDFLISPGSQPSPIAVSLANNCATLTGTFRSETQNLSAFALLVSDSAPTAPKLFPVQSNQTFTFSGLSPGGYRIWAFSNIAGLEYANPDALRDYPSQQVTLDANQKATVNLDLVVRRSN